MKTLYHIQLIVFTICCLQGCTPSTHMTASWKKPGYTGDRSLAVMVMGISQDLRVRGTVENEIVKRLREKGVKAVPSLNYISPEWKDQKSNEDSLKKILGQQNLNALLTVSLLDEKEETRYVPGNGYYNPAPFYNYYGSYHMMMNQWMATPGYTTRSTTYFLESNLYGGKTLDLLWTAQSQTTDPASISDFARSYASQLVKTMSKEKVIFK